MNTILLSMQIPLLWVAIVIFLLIAESVGIFLGIRYLLRKIKKNSDLILFNRQKIKKNKEKINSHSH